MPFAACAGGFSWPSPIGWLKKYEGGEFNPRAVGFILCDSINLVIAKINKFAENVVNWRVLIQKMGARNRSTGPAYFVYYVLKR